jgi:branched-chain amino acid transport system substrate-binding protein
VKKISFGFIMFVLITVLVAGCENEGASTTGSNNDDSLKIGLAAPLSGSSAEYGEQFKKGAELAIKLTNTTKGDVYEDGIPFSILHVGERYMSLLTSE